MPRREGGHIRQHGRWRDCGQEPMVVSAGRNGSDRVKRPRIGWFESSQGPGAQELSLVGWYVALGRRGQEQGGPECESPANEVPGCGPWAKRTPRRTGHHLWEFSDP